MGERNGVKPGGVILAGWVEFAVDGSNFDPVGGKGVAGLFEDGVGGVGGEPGVPEGFGEDERPNRAHKGDFGA